MRHTYLHSNWHFSNITANPPYVRSAVQYQPPLPATVPGYVHLDLLANGVIADPFTEMNELGCRWVDEADWSYKTEFSWVPDPMLPSRVLKFEGLDTVAEVLLNGTSIGHFDNMFLPVEIDVASYLVEGNNELEVRFSSAVKVGEQRRKEYFKAEGLVPELKQFDERAFVRKAQYMSAWDWGPRLISCGIWQPVALLEYAARIKSFSVLQERLDNGSIRIYSVTELEGTGEVTLRFGDHSKTSHSEGLQELDLVIQEPKLWWPVGMGEQHLYPASASMQGANTIEKKIGLRTIELEQKADEFGESFTIVVNGDRVWARGANWIPNDSFPSRVSREEYLSQIGQCRTLGMNMLRVWGGGLYELEGFYDACDEAGILVWQDFTYGCSYYPDGAEACEVAEKEASYHVKRLRDRACLALWCGNNENLTMWQSKWGGELSPPRYYGEKIYDEVLPEVIKRLDLERSYIASSPIGQGEGEKASANDGGYGDSHYWDVWHGRGDWIHYQDSDTRFSSEFGFASSCSLEMWNQTISKSQWAHSSPSVRWHDKTGKAWETFFGYVTTHYPEPKTLEDWTYYSQLNQRDALRYGIEHWRRAEFCQGTLIWQFNDCWPVQSWAVQDYLRLLKPAGYELKRLYSDRLVSLLRREDEIAVYLINDSKESWNGTLEIDHVLIKDGSLLSARELPFTVVPGQRQLVAKEASELASASFLRVKAEEITSVALFSEPKDLEFDAPTFNVEASGSDLTIKTEGVAFDLVVTDLDDGKNLAPRSVPICGANAVTAVNESLIWSYVNRPKRISLRSLAGEQIVDL